MATITVRGSYGDREIFLYRSGLIAWAAVGLVVGGMVETQSNTRAQQRLETIEECTPVIPSMKNPDFAECLRDGGSNRLGSIMLEGPITQEILDTQIKKDTAETQYEGERLLVWAASGPFAVPAVAIQWIF